MNRAEFVEDMFLLVTDLIPTIGDEYRSSDQEKDDTAPQMDLTIGANNAHWGFQTGDNSYTGGAYSFPDWATVVLTRESNPAEVAEEIASQFENDAEENIFEQDEG